MERERERERREIEVPTLRLYRDFTLSVYTLQDFFAIRIFLIFGV